MNKKNKMKNILIVLGIVLGIAVFAAGSGLFKKNKPTQVKEEKQEIMDIKNAREIYFAGGCFWGTEHFFQQIRGVVGTEVGYANGNTQNPTYEEVVSHTTGFAETVKVNSCSVLISSVISLLIFTGGINGFKIKVNQQF